MVRNMKLSLYINRGEPVDPKLHMMVSSTTKKKLKGLSNLFTKKNKKEVQKTLESHLLCLEMQTMQQSAWKKIG